MHQPYIEVGRIEPGQTYRHHEMRTVKREGERIVEEVALELYKVEGFALDGRTRSEVVVYRGINGFDMGRLFVTTPYDFALRFRPEPVEATNGS